MKYKVLFVSLLSTLVMPYGGATAMDWKFELPFTSSHLISTANETQDQAAITFSRIDHQVGGNGAIDITQRLQTFTKALGNQAVSLEDAINHLILILAEVPGIDLKTKIANLTQAREKEKMTKRDLMQILSIMQSEQAETNALLKVLEQKLSPIPQPSIPHETQRPTLFSSNLPSVTSPSHSTGTLTGLSSYQQGLFSRKGQIGNEAWKLLGGDNTNLAAALSNSIQQNLGTVEILTLEKNSFNLSINGKGQDQLYKF
jgi:hypothetical protein